MVKRLHARRETRPEIDALKARRRQLLQGMSYGLNADGQRYGLSMSARF
jgi:hypothetical protein